MTARRDVALDYPRVRHAAGTARAAVALEVIPLSGVVMVETPQDVALLDVRKAIAMFPAANVPMLGVVENMSYSSARHWHALRDLREAAQEGGRRVRGAALGQLRRPRHPQGGDEERPIIVRR